MTPATPAADPRPFDTTLNRMYNRRALDQLPAHLATTYGIEVTATERLDVGVIRVDRADGPSWVARVFSHLRPSEATAGDDAVLRHLERQGFPAERLATKQPISTLDGQEVLVTTFVEREKRPRLPDAQESFGRQLGRLHALRKPTGAAGRPAGALHHYSEGSRRDELRTAASWLDQVDDRVPAEARADFERLRTAVSEADAGDGLPTALIHPDPVGKNTVLTAEGFTYVDWTGAGVGPRAVSLEWLLGANPGSARIVRGYAEHVTLTDEEWERLPGIAESRRLIGMCFAVAMRPEQTSQMVKRLTGIRREARKAVSAARPGAAV